MTDTPETDAMSGYAAYGETQIVNASFARRLERERNALKVEAYKYIELWDRATKELESLKSNAQL